MDYYPQYPISFTDPQSDPVEVYRHYRSLGFFVMPKLAHAKVPHSAWWGKDAPPHSDEETLAAQHWDNIEGWCVATGSRSGRLVVLDFDPGAMDDAVAAYYMVQEMSPTSFVYGTPARGVHLYYRLREDQAMLGNRPAPLRGLDVRAEGGQVVARCGYNTYHGKAAAKKGVPDGHRGTYVEIDGGVYDSVPYMSDELYEWLTVDVPEEAHKQQAVRHVAQPVHLQQDVVLECLTWVLASWDADASYDEWLRLWMSAHHGSQGGQVVRDFLLTHENIVWSDGQRGKDRFRRVWDAHKPEEGGFTVASLFWLAKRAGWLQHTGYEIPDALCELIEVSYIPDWVPEDVPPRLLLMSQTGSGKTQSIPLLYERLGRPKTVVFVPTIKLATELAYTLQQAIPETRLYLESSPEEMRSAQVLVTTLQTFAMRLRGADMAEYGLVYVEESDQIIAQFSRGGGGVYGSHVSEYEARYGFAVLREAAQKAGVMWCVDATMSQVTYDAAAAWGRFRVVRNKYRRAKAPVFLVDTKGQAYQAVLEARLRGERVVVVCDTATDAHEVIDTMKALEVAGRHLCVTRDTENDPEVRAYMRDVNAGAARYDLLAYNSCMASGVSVTAVTPDLIVQVARYLTPRVNLQLLNRYRSQKRVVVFYRNGENLYAKRSQDILSEAKRRAWMESQVAGLPLIARSSDAELRAHLASVAVGDEEQQNRSARTLYLSLLREDGRQIMNKTLEETLEGTLKALRAKKKAEKAEIAEIWPEIEEERERILRILRGYIPEGVENAEIYRIATQFEAYLAPLLSLVNQEKTLQRAESFLADSGKAITAFSNRLSMVKLISSVAHVLPHLDQAYDAAGEEAFMKELRMRRDLYDAVVLRSSQAWDEDREPVAYAKILLGLVGLKLRRVRKGRQSEYRIENYADVQKLLEWRRQGEKLQTICYQVERENDFHTLTAEQQQTIIKLIVEGYTYEQARGGIE